MDDIIRNAADKHHPVYNDKAWAKMEMKLDKHLPQKEGRRRYIFFLLFFLLLGGGAFFAFIYVTGSKNSISTGVAQNKDDKRSATAITSEKITPVPDHIESTAGNNANVTKEITDNPMGNVTNTGQPESSNSMNTEVSGKKKRSPGVNKAKSKMSITAADDLDESEKAGKQKTENSVPQNRNTVDKMNITITAATPENSESENVSVTPANPEKEKNITEEKKKEVVKEDTDIKKENIASTEKKSPPSKDKKKSQKSFAGNFGITFSAGPDVSFIQLNEPGKVTLAYGAGLSYSFAKRFTARAGFYFAKKIYSAEPYEYHMPGGVTYPNLTSVDANCRVYEIPISLSYNFIQKKNHSGFAGIGISSLLMKNEHYDYNYKTPTGYTYKYSKEVSNENQHYFSVLTLSGGYQYQLNKRVSLQAEPYVKLPLSGIGLGKIDLSSAGILFSVTVKPFAKRK